MSWICVGCHQVQETKNGFAPVLNHTHHVVEQAPPVDNEHVAPGCELFDSTTASAPVTVPIAETAGPIAGLTADELAKLRTEMKGMTAEELKQLLGEL